MEPIAKVNVVKNNNQKLEQILKNKRLIAYSNLKVTDVPEPTHQTSISGEVSPDPKTLKARNINTHKETESITPVLQDEELLLSPQERIKNLQERSKEKLE